MTFPLGASCRLLAAVFSAKRSLATVEKLSTLPSLAKTSSFRVVDRVRAFLILPFKVLEKPVARAWAWSRSAAFCLLSLDVTEQAEAEDDQQNQSSRDKQVVVLVCFPKLFKHAELRLICCYNIISYQL